MKISIKKTKEAYELLENYSGDNQYLKNLKYHVFQKKDKQMNDLDMEYILKNYNFKIENINKIAKISKWFGEKCKEKWGVDFTPEKVLITHIVGETDNVLHVYLRYRKSQDKLESCFIPKKALLTNVRLSDYREFPVDFTECDSLLDKNSRKMFEHQRDDVKFLLARRKAIIANQPGLGKTTSVIAASVIGKFKKVLVICPASLKSNWRRELINFVSPDEIGIVNSDKWVNDKKYTIINYDILDRYYKIPTEELIEEVKTNDGIKIVKTEVKSTKSSIIEEARRNSKLLTENFDLVIIDEAHKLSNNTSNRYKVILDFVKRSKIEDIYLMTGTPITNRPLNFLNILTLIEHELSKDWEFYVTSYCDGKQITPRKTGKKIWITSGSSNLDELKEKVKDCYIRKTKEDIPNMVTKTVVERYYDLNPSEEKEYTILQITFPKGTVHRI